MKKTSKKSTQRFHPADRLGRLGPEMKSQRKILTELLFQRCQISRLVE